MLQNIVFHSFIVFILESSLSIFNLLNFGDRLNLNVLQLAKYTTQKYSLKAGDSLQKKMRRTTGAQGYNFPTSF